MNEEKTKQFLKCRKEQRKEESSFKKISKTLRFSLSFFCERGKNQRICIFFVLFYFIFFSGGVYLHFNSCSSFSSTVACTTFFCRPFCESSFSAVHRLEYHLRC